MISYVIHTDKQPYELEQLGLTVIGETMYAIVVEDIQEYAKTKIGRELTKDELYIAQKGISSGLNSDIDVVYETAINEAIREAEE